MRIIFFGLVFIVILFGCSIGKGYYGYRVHVKNVGTHELRDVEIESQKGFWFGTGYLGGGALAGIGRPQQAPPNDIFTIILKREDGTEAKHIMDLREIVEKGFRGRILIIINDNNELKYELQKE